MQGTARSQLASDPLCAIFSQLRRSLFLENLQKCLEAKERGRCIDGASGRRGKLGSDTTARVSADASPLHNTVGVSMLAGSLAGITEHAVIFPVDSIKVRKGWQRMHDDSSGHRKRDCSEVEED